MRLVCLLLLSALAPGAAPPAAAAEPELFLSWNAPHGAPGASALLARPCGDTSRVDTLYLCVRPGRDAPGIYAFNGQVLLTAGVGDSLGPFWRPEGRPQRPPFMELEFPADSAGAGASPWIAPGRGSFAYDFTLTNARFRFFFATTAAAVAPVSADRIYTLARVLLRRPPAGSPHCDGAVCLQFVSAGLMLEAMTPAVFGISGRNRFVSLNSAGDRVCREQRIAPPIIPPPAPADTTHRH